MIDLAVSFMKISARNSCCIYQYGEWRDDKGGRQVEKSMECSNVGGESRAVVLIFF